MALVKDIIEKLEERAPLALAESWDNVGLQVGDANAEVRHVLLAVDCDATTLKSALGRRKHAQLLVVHHPLIFKPLTAVNCASPKGALIKELIKHDVALYAAHTNADNSLQFSGSRRLAALLGLEGLSTLGAAEEDALVRLSFLVPEKQTDDVASALLAAGVEQVELAAVPLLKRGEKPNDLVSEAAVAMEFDCAAADLAFFSRHVRQALGGKPSRYNVLPLGNHNNVYAAGVLGKTTHLVAVEALATQLAEQLGAKTVGIGGDPERKVQHVAICAGSGRSFVQEAAKRGAELFITGELDFHTAQDALQQGLGLVILGHAISEQPTVLAMQEFLERQFPKLSFDHCEPLEPVSWAPDMKPAK